MAVNDACATVPGDNNFERSVISVLLCGRSTSDGFDNAGLKGLRHFLIEFYTRYVSYRTQKKVTPPTMLNYVRRVQHRIRELGLSVNLFSDPIFTDPVEGLCPVLDNKFAMQQAEGQITKSHNILTIDDIGTIFGSEHCNPKNSEGFRHKFIFAVGLATDVRPTELCMLNLSQFNPEAVN